MVPQQACKVEMCSTWNILLVRLYKYINVRNTEEVARFIRLRPAALGRSVPLRRGCLFRLVLGRLILEHRLHHSKLDLQGKMPRMAVSYPKDLAQHVHKELLLRKERPPAPRVLETLLEILYFASLKREEAQPISCRVAFIRRHNPDPKPPQRIVTDRWGYFTLADDLPLTVSNLVKLSKAVDPWGSTLAVDCDAQDRLRIWGLIDQSVHFSTYVMKETSIGPEMPGMFQVVIQGVGEIAVYKTYVLLGGLKQDLLVTKQHRVLQSGPVHSKLMGSIERYQKRVISSVGKRVYEIRDHWNESLEKLWVSILCRILIGIQRYGHGGAVLISDGEDGLNPKYSLTYPRLPEALVRNGSQTIKGTLYSDRINECLDNTPDEIPADLYLDQAGTTANLREIGGELTGCVRFLTSLSRVDGLIWLSSNLSLQAFGVEITLRNDPSKVFRALDSNATKLKRLDLSHFGMRHRSMIRYCAANRDAVGFVVSQDGDVRAVTRVHDFVVLWENVRIQSVLIPKQVRSA